MFVLVNAKMFLYSVLSEKIRFDSLQQTTCLKKNRNICSLRDFFYFVILPHLRQTHFCGIEMLLPYKSRAHCFSCIFLVSYQPLLFYVVTVVRPGSIAKKVLCSLMYLCSFQEKKSQLSLFYRRQGALLNRLIKNQTLLWIFFLNLKCL